MHPDHIGHASVQRAVTVHQPTPIPPPAAAPLVPAQPPGPVPAVASIVLPDGRVVTGYAIEPAHPQPATTAPPAVSRTAVNLALTGVGFAALCGGLALAAGFIAALAALIHQVMICAAVVFGGYIAVRVLGTGRNGSGTTVHIRKAVIKRNHFHN